MARPLSLHLRSHRKSSSTVSNSASPTTPSATSSGAITDRHPSSPAPTKSASASRQDAAAVVVASRAEILRLTKNDWVYPTSEQTEDLRVDDDTQYLPRTEDPLTPSRSPSPPLNPGARNPEKDPYRFEDPDDVGQSLEERCKRRRNETDAEVFINEGLRIFEARRNAWTGAVRVKGSRDDWPEGASISRSQALKLEVPAPYGVTSGIQLGLPQVESNASAGTASTKSSDDLSSAEAEKAEHAANPAEDQAEDQAEDSDEDSNDIDDENNDDPDDLEQDGDTSRNTSLDTSPSLPSSTTTPLSSAPSSTVPLSTTLLVPICYPLLPRTHPTRALITPIAYPSIYSRVIVQGTSPRLPIPLPDIINSCVSGWKADGEWPPKATPGGPEPSIGRRRRVSVRDGMKEGLERGVRKVLRIVRGEGEMDGIVGGGGGQENFNG